MPFSYQCILLIIAPVVASDHSTPARNVSPPGRTTYPTDHQNVELPMEVEDEVWTSFKAFPPRDR